MASTPSLTTKRADEMRLNIPRRKLNMKISLGNATYNHKPDQNDMVWHSGFLNCKRQPISCPIIEDTATNYAWAYDNGLCVKGYMFKTEKDIWKHTFVCDFDNLTEAQYNKVIELVKTCGLKTIQGRQSSGMKMDCYQHEGIPDWKPSKWKYKVFFPLDEFYNSNGVMSIREEVEKAYFDIVWFFNNATAQSREKSDDVARLWLKANNQSKFYKHGKKKGLPRTRHPSLVIEDPIFSNWILPDPVEVTNPRHQITYAIIPEQHEPFKYMRDEDWERIFHCHMVARFPTSTKDTFTEIVDLPYDFKDELEKKISKTDEKMGEPTTSEVSQLTQAILNALKKPGKGTTPSIPTSRSKMAKMSQKNEWQDLIIDTKTAATVNRAIYSDWEYEYEMDKVKPVMFDTVKFLTRCEVEYQFGVMGQPNKGAVLNKVVNDLPYYTTAIFGDTFIAEMNTKKLNPLARSMANKILKTYQTFKVWRLEQKTLLTMAEDPNLNSKWMKARKQLSLTMDFKAYYAIKEQLLNEVGTTAKQRQFPYIYVRRGLKKEMIDNALNEVTPMSMEQFVDWAMVKVTAQDGLIEEEKVRKWYRDYQSRFNKNQKMGTGDEMIDNCLTGYVLKNGKVLKKHKQRKSPYDEIFKGMTKEEISVWIDNADIHRQTKKRLKERYL